MPGATIKLISGVKNTIVLIPKPQAQIKLTRTGLPGPQGPPGVGVSEELAIAYGVAL